jgi:hypothetical protein
MSHDGSSVSGPRLAARTRIAIAASAGLTAVQILATGVHAATELMPEEPPIAVSPLLIVIPLAVQFVPLVALVLAVIFRARLRAADGTRVRPVLAIRGLLLAGIVALPLGIAAMPLCATIDHSYLLPGLWCVVPGIILATVGGTAFILHAPLSRIFATRPTAAAGAAMALSVPTILAYGIVTSGIIGLVNGI